MATPVVTGLPIVGSALGMAKDPARFFVKCYREHGPVFRVRLMGKTYTVIAGTDAANFLNTREGRECLRSKEFWQGLVDEYGATRTISGEDGESHKELRDMMRRGYSREAVKGRHDELVAITDRSIERDWRVGERVPVVRAMQYLVTDQLGSILTGIAPMEYVPDIRLTTLYILNVLVTRQRPKVLLRDPRYKRAKARVFELGERMIADYHAAGQRPDNLVRDIMDAHVTNPRAMPADDLVLSLTGPYVAGLDTVANTVAAFVYAVLKHPHVLARVRAEADALFGGGSLDDEALKKIPAIRGALMETMRLYPIAVAQMRTATRDFTFAGHLIKAGETLYIGTSVPHFMDEYFPEPETFDIDRYEKPRAEHMGSGVYSPYGRGQHTCLGKSLADVQMMLSMARLFHKLDLALDPPGYTLVTKTAPTPGPSMRFKVRVKGYRN
ncbi:cytochrome P450 [Phytohabitans kaempferiae]|uniref:Cytochrome P450 n=1 Tax=Phytohabitans kaempferiae TaxID=1620943 RepID=A0ABV6LYY8_9ACTN